MFHEKAGFPDHSAANFSCWPWHAHLNREGIDRCMIPTAGAEAFDAGREVELKDMLGQHRVYEVALT